MASLTVEQGKEVQRCIWKSASRNSSRHFLMDHSTIIEEQLLRYLRSNACEPSIRRLLEFNHIKKSDKSIVAFLLIILWSKLTFHPWILFYPSGKLSVAGFGHIEESLQIFSPSRPKYLSLLQARRLVPPVSPIALAHEREAVKYIFWTAIAVLKSSSIRGIPLDLLSKLQSRVMLSEGYQ